MPIYLSIDVSIKGSIFDAKNIFYGRAKAIAIITIVLIITISYGLFFYLQDTNEKRIRNDLVTQQRERQIDLTRTLSQHIGSDLTLISSRLEGLSNSMYLQQGDLTSNKTKGLIESNFLESDNIIDRLLTVNKENVITIDIGPTGERTFAGTNISHRQYVIQPRITLEPFFSAGFMGLDGNYRIALSHPIVNTETGDFIGLIVALIPTEKFFEHYGNIYDIKSQFLVTFDKNGSILAIGANKNFVGEDYFGETVQKFINYNSILNNLTRNLLDGNSGYAVYDYGRGERLTTQSPIFVNDRPTYFIQVVTPSTEIYLKINETLLTQRTETFTLLAGTTAAIVVLIIFLSKWSSLLGTEVKRRTRELEMSYEETKQYLNTVLKEVRKYKK